MCPMLFLCGFSVAQVVLSPFCERSNWSNNMRFQIPMSVHNIEWVLFSNGTGNHRGDIAAFDSSNFDQNIKSEMQNPLAKTNDNATCYIISPVSWNFLLSSGFLLAFLLCFDFSIPIFRAVWRNMSKISKRLRALAPTKSPTEPPISPENENKFTQMSL